MKSWNSLSRFQDKLHHHGSRFIEDLEQITNCFDKGTKLRFKSPDEPAYIKFGGMRDKDPNVDIRSGQMKLAG